MCVCVCERGRASGSRSRSARVLGHRCSPLAGGELRGDCCPGMWSKKLFTDKMGQQFRGGRSWAVLGNIWCADQTDWMHVCCFSAPLCSWLALPGCASTGPHGASVMSVDHGLSPGLITLCSEPPRLAQKSFGVDNPMLPMFSKCLNF